MGALPAFRHYGMHATFYVPSGLVCRLAADPGCTTNFAYPFALVNRTLQILAQRCGYN